MKEQLEKLIREIEEKIDPDFDFDQEHWENGNFDDSYNYGVESGEEHAYRDVLEKLKKLV